MDEKEKELFTTTTGIRGNIRYITISDNIPEHWESLLDIAKSSYSYYWYIIHDQDSDVDKHLHLVCCDAAGTSLKAHIERFCSVIPGNMICKVKSPRAILRYLIHKDSPKKFQYSSDLVQTNNSDYFLSCIELVKVDDQYVDYLKVLRKELSPAEFIKKYESEFRHLNFYQKIMTFDKISKLF